MKYGYMEKLGDALEDMHRGFTLVLITLSVLVWIGLVILLPIATIWALNTVFPALAISYTWKTWLAVWVWTLVNTGYKKTVRKCVDGNDNCCSKVKDTGHPIDLFK